MKSEKVKTKKEQVELLEMKIAYHEKHIQTLKNLIQSEIEK
jgi:hypothetical protein